MRFKIAPGAPFIAVTAVVIVAVIAAALLASGGPARGGTNVLSPAPGEAREQRLVVRGGGETEDALLIFLPDSGVLFAGDILMPYYGEPWVEEGFLDSAVQTMEQVIVRDPRHILHGHRPLTTMYGPGQIGEFRDAYQWLVETATQHLRSGYSAKDIVRLNLIPPGLEDRPDLFVSYLAPRDHIISRLADHLVGIWQEDRTGQEPAGLDNLTAVEYGRLLKIYLGLSAGDVGTELTHDPASPAQHSILDNQ